MQQVEHCPWCGNQITHVEFLEIQERIRQEERRKAAETEAAVRADTEQRLRAQFTAEKVSLLAEQKAAAQQRLDAVAAERDGLSTRLKSLEQQQIVQIADLTERLKASERASQEREKTVRAELSQRHGAELETQKARAAAAAREDILAQLRSVATEKAALEEKVKNVDTLVAAARKEAVEDTQQSLLLLGQEKAVLADKLAAVEKQRETLQLAHREELAVQLQLQATQAENTRLKDLAEMREILAKDRDETLAKQQAESARQNEGLVKKLKDMERQLEKKTAQELGDGAEIDLYESLKGYFAYDKIERVPKGQPGADIVQEVLYKGEACGRILYDSKARRSWQNGYITKLREDQITSKADVAILASTAFPAGQKEFWIEKGVIVVNPARVVYVVQVVREYMIKMHRAGLANHARTGKMNRLYQFIASEEFRTRFGEVVTLVSRIASLDAGELEAHRKTWQERGILLKKQEHLLMDLGTQLAAILEASDQSEAQSA